MMLSMHSSVGAAIGASTNNPFAAIPAALVSHLLLDSFPHTDIAHLAPLNKDGTMSNIIPKWVPIVVVFDLLLTIAIVTLGVLTYPERATAIILGAFFGIFPDFQYAPKFGPWLYKQFWYKGYAWLHENGHCHFPLSYAQRFYGFHPQILCLIGGVAWLFHC